MRSSDTCGTNFRDLGEDEWREAALIAALRAPSGVGSSAALNALVAVTRVRGLPSVVLAVPRTTLLRFLERHAGVKTALRPLVPATPVAAARGAGDSSDTGLRPGVGWYAFTWDDSEYEVAFATLNGAAQGILCLGASDTDLERFALAVTEAGIRPEHRCLRFSGGWQVAEDLDAEMGRVTWDDVVLPPALLTEVRTAVEGWWSNRAAFDRLGFPWRRGILFIGPPGTGKTMLCKAIGAALPELPFLYVRDTRDRGETEVLQVIFERARRLSPCILAFEDIDGLVGERSRTLFLNELDGFAANEGMLIIASSNHPERIDEALLKRPSRFDRVFHIGLPGAEERAEFACRLLVRTLGIEGEGSAVPRKVEELARQVAERTEGFTPAYLKEALVSAALSLAQQNGADPVTFEPLAAAVQEQVETLRQHLRRLRDPAALVDIPTGQSEAIGLRRSPS